MAVGTVYGNNFTSAGTPKEGRGFSNNVANTQTDTDVLTIATTSIDDAGDRVYFFAVPEGALIESIEMENADLDTGATLDADWILNEVVGGVSTDTVLFNMGATLQTASSLGAPETRICDQAVAKSLDARYALVGLLVNTAAGTAASGEVRARLTWRRPN